MIRATEYQRHIIMDLSVCHWQQTKNVQITKNNYFLVYKIAIFTLIYFN